MVVETEYPSVCCLPITAVNRHLHSEPVQRDYDLLLRAAKAMNVRICAIPADANHVQACRDVCSRFFDAIATAAISSTKAINMRGARMKAKTFR